MGRAAKPKGKPNPPEKIRKYFLKGSKVVLNQQRFGVQSGNPVSTNGPTPETRINPKGLTSIYLSIKTRIRITEIKLW